MNSGDFSIGSTVWPGISKLIEECGEVVQVAGKLMGSKGEILHWDGTNLKDRLESELGDLAAAINFVIDHCGLDLIAVDARHKEKARTFEAWHREGDPTPGEVHTTAPSFTEELREAVGGAWDDVTLDENREPIHQADDPAPFVSLAGIATDLTDGQDTAEWLRDKWRRQDSAPAVPQADGDGEGPATCDRPRIHYVDLPNPYGLAEFKRTVCELHPGECSAFTDWATVCGATALPQTDRCAAHPKEKA